MSKTIYSCDVCDKTFKTKQALCGHKVCHSDKFKNICNEKNMIVQSEYLKNPKLCKTCQKQIPYEKRSNTFCNSSCAAFNSNKKRGLKSKETREKLSLASKLFYLPKTKIQFCQCEYCGINFVWNDITKGTLRFCSKNCSKQFISNLASERLKNTPVREKYERGRKSYMEQSFEDWLNEYSISFQMEKHYYNFELKKNYYVDFYFPQFNLVIELDGTQHRNNLEKDKIRDEFLSRIHKLNVVRISHKEFVKKLKYDEICELLNIIL